MSKRTSSESSGSGSAVWPFGHGGASNGPFNLLKQRPWQSNDYGELFQASPDDYKQLKKMDVSVSLANITGGSMFGPYFNTKAIKIALVIDGSGNIEMARPHLSSSRGQEQQQQGSGSYKKIEARISRGDIYVVPSGHPIVTVSSGHQNLEAVCFEINTEGNEKIDLAGKNDVLNQLEKEAKELSFNITAKEVEDILSNQKESFFFPGPQNWQEQDRAFKYRMVAYVYLCCRL
ncbi:hypothetical protein GIB67_033552 [Kingdonia uniflora]|uniref:Cupin type-1 domain-containing protein n=1 Tax=Kingdonia uniflora TaxID=39325 RepID=A0A7J7L6G0_9MAGN|nr:hypothetical protein GIB67_033552 [Kingdonia uniflora]